MLYSRLFTKTSKDFPADESSKNAQLLIRGGFVYKTMAGVYAMLPLGLRVLNKIENIVREEMNKIGSQEILMNTLHPRDFWQTTGRWENVDILFKLKSQTKSEYAVAASHEEQVTPIAKNFISSWKDLPQYQPGADTHYKSYLMGASGITKKQLEEVGAVVYEQLENGDYKLWVAIQNLDEYFELLSKKMTNGFWNEVVGNDTHFLFKFEDGSAKRLQLTEETAYEIECLGNQFNNQTKPEDDGQSHARIVENWFIKGADGWYVDWLDGQKTTTFPLSVYQIQTKFRDELRAKSGLLRGREFRMKDMYDFHRNQQSLDWYYQQVQQAYENVYKRLGLEVYMVEASGGIFTKNPSHEFQAVCEAGEDEIFIVSKTNLVFNKEVAPAALSVPNKVDEQFLPLEDIFAPETVGVEALHKLLKVPIEKTTKTMFFNDENKNLIVAVVRGDREVNLEKLQKIVQSQTLVLAEEELVEKMTGAKLGFAGLLNLPKNEKIKVFVDDSCQNLTNFECGTNKTGYHSINVNFGRDVEMPAKFYDIKEVQSGDLHPTTGFAYEIKVSAEVGNIFKLGDKYTKAFNLTYNDQDNKPKLPLMSCHGIGTSRCLAVIAEIFSDEKGLKWPKSVAPFTFNLLTFINKKDENEIQTKFKNIAKKIYKGLNSGQIQFDFEQKKLFFVLKSPTNISQECFWDDRDEESLGTKLKDADLMGCPVQLILTKRSLENGGLEVKLRETGESFIVSLENLE